VVAEAGQQLTGVFWYHSGMRWRFLSPVDILAWRQLANKP
jgi:hypothetical protein